MDIAGIIIIGLIVFFVAGRIHLHWKFNNGHCRKCGGTYRHIGSDSQGGDGYVCDGCGDEIWL